MSDLLDLVLDAHGGREAWAALDSVSAHVRCGGLAITMKGQARLAADFSATVSAREPRTVIDAFGGPGTRGVFERDRVRIESDAGEVLEERADPRRLYPGLRRRLWWDPLDMLHFAGYALWSYLTAPLLLVRPDVLTREIAPHAGLRRLDVTFPPGLPVHSREQVFHVSATGEVRRFDYTAEVFGSWARAAHHCFDYRRFDGLRLPVRRRVVPRGPGFRWALPGPTLVWIELGALSRG